MLKTRALSLQAATAAVAMLAILWTAGTEAAIPHWRSSAALMQYGLRQNPNSGAPHIYKGIDLQYRAGDLAGATREYRTAMQVNESSHPLVVPVICQAKLGLGQIANLENRPEEAVEDFQVVLRLCPDGQASFAVYDALGSMAFAKREYAEAAESFRKAVEWGPSDIAGHYYLGTCQMKLGQYREAAEQFHIVTEIDPSVRPAFVAEAAALDAAGDAAQAARVRAQIPSL
jgi:tetratricopeptide (TPR) repeat protein